MPKEYSLSDVLERMYQNQLASIAQDDVDATKVFVDCCHGLEHSLAVCNIEVQRQYGIPVLFYQWFKGRRVACANSDFISALQRGSGPDTSKSTGCPGDEPYFFGRL